VSLQNYLKHRGFLPWLRNIGGKTNLLAYIDVEETSPRKDGASNPRHVRYSLISANVIQHAEKRRESQSTYTDFKKKTTWKILSDVSMAIMSTRPRNAMTGRAPRRVVSKVKIIMLI
jgi:hypothetical protein